MNDTPSTERADQDGTASQQQPLAVQPRGTIAVGDRGLHFADMDQMFRFAKAVSASKFCPPGFSEIDCFICLQKGAEVGMTPMQALESIYVVNNRATLFGDAPKALCEASGLMTDYEQGYEGEPGTDDFRAVVTSKRKDRKAMTETFSVSDAKAAELWGKKGPWTQYPRRMLMFRARGYNLRDNFGDILKGFQIGELVEENQGFDNAKPAKVVSPNFNGGSSSSSQEAASPIEPTRRRGRPPKEQPLFPEPSAPTGPTRIPVPPTPTPTQPLVEPTPKEETPESAQPLEPEPSAPIDQVRARLTKEKISEENFLLLLHDFGLIDCERTDIGMGYMTLGKVEKHDLELALSDWDRVIQTLRTVS